MKPGPDKVLACPNCETLIVVFSLASGNTIDARTWTDGKMEAPMLPELPALAKCRICQAYYWLADAQPVGEIPLWGTQREAIPESWKKAARIRDLTEEELFEALDRVAAKSRDQELYLRFRTWWAGNDVWRDEPSQNVGLGKTARRPEAVHNLESLLNILDDDKLSERLFKAEILRELERYAEALLLLDTAFPASLLPTVELIRSLARENDPLVREMIE
jgi:hypothetical protein